MAVASSLEAALDEAAAAADRAGPGEGLKTLQRTLREPVAPAPPERWSACLSRLGAWAGALGLATLAARAAAAAAGPTDPRALFDLGYELIEVEAPSLAAAVLGRARELAPESAEILTELATALELDLGNHRALEHLRGAPSALQGRFMVRYLTAFHALMTGDLATPRALHPALAADPDPTHAFMAATLEGMLARAAALAGTSPLDSKDLRGWHFVLSGGLLTHLSPYGFDEGMAGRYAAVYQTPALVREGLERLARTLAALEQAPARVFGFEERGSAILAAATARLLGLPLVPFGSGPPDGLVVVYDLARLGPAELRPLLDHRPSQILFAHAVSWTDEPPFAPDLATLLYQFDRPPWEPGPGFDPATRSPIERPPDLRPPAELGAELADLPPEPGALSDLPQVEALVRAGRRAGLDHGPGALRPGGRRRRMFRGSPVPSSRFA